MGKKAWIFLGLALRAPLIFLLQSLEKNSRKWFIFHDIGLHLFPKENKCLHYCFVKDIARNVILPSVCPQPVRRAVCLYGWILFCCHCKRVVSYSFKVWCLTWRLSNHYSKEKNRNLWNNTFFARATYYNLL